MDPQSTRRRRSIGAIALCGMLALTTVGCTAEQKRGFLPGDSAHEATNQTGRIMNLWVGSWIAALFVGLVVWGLIIWCVIAYRRRKTDTGFPVQLRYHAPIEMIFTLVPVVMVLVLFYFTQRDITAIQKVDAKPDYTINVVGKQWSWDFNYVNDDVHSSGVQIKEDPNGNPVQDAGNTLYLPVNKSVKFELTSRDVNHSFWVIGFLYKMDVIPGRTNVFQITPTREGTYKGKCAELCGEYHSDMLFDVKVVSQAEYDKQMQTLQATGNTGLLGEEYDRNKTAWSNKQTWEKSEQSESGSQ